MSGTGSHNPMEPQQEEDEETLKTTIMAALSTLTPPQFSSLTRSILSLALRHHHRLLSLLSCPSSFSLTLHHLRSLPLPHKSLLIATHLLSSLHLLTRHFLPPHRSPSISHRDLDSALLLLLLCDVHQHSPDVLLQFPNSAWREILASRWSNNILCSASVVGAHYGGVILPFIEMIIRCWRFVNVMGGCVVGKEGREVAAAPAVVVALPAVEIRDGEDGGECGICQEEMRGGRDVCELPCKHLFHWMCILPWLKKTNTCPYCRFQLPTEDTFREIQRLWSVLLKIGTGGTLDVERS